MSINQPHSLLTVPSGRLQIPATAFIWDDSLEPPLSDASEESLRDRVNQPILLTNWDQAQQSDLIKSATRPILFSLVLPTYNEGKNIEKLVHLLTQLLDGVIPQAYELIVVDDNSPDRTWELAAALMPDYPQLRVMRRIEERGLSTAIIRGWQVAQGEILGVIDADLQHPPDVLLQLWGEIERGADLAIASRHVEGGGVSDWSLMRRVLSRGAQVIGLILLPGVFGRVSDPMSGYFLVRRSSLVGQTLRPVGYKILIEVLARGKVRWIAEAGYVFQERQEGTSKVTWKQYVEYLQHLLKLRLSLWSIGWFI
jgi:dolichol-phosphate mannosyltransferase